MSDIYFDDTGSEASDREIERAEDGTMKKEVTKTIDICDFCGEDPTYYECQKCGRVCCFGCLKLHGTQYAHAVFVGGSGDGFYCNSCDTQLKAAGEKDVLHSAYLEIDRLRNEYKQWQAAFDIRSKAAEVELKRLQESAK